MTCRSPHHSVVEMIFSFVDKNRTLVKERPLKGFMVFHRDKANKRSLTSSFHLLSKFLNFTLVVETQRVWFLPCVKSLVKGYLMVKLTDSIPRFSPVILVPKSFCVLLTPDLPTGVRFSRLGVH